MYYVTRKVKFHRICEIPNSGQPKTSGLWLQHHVIEPPQLCINQAAAETAPSPLSRLCYGAT